MKKTLFFACFAISKAHAFCGFYVAKADASLFNRASQVAVVRNEDRTVISMLNDYQGDLREFAMVVPVPQVLDKGQVHVGDKALFEHLDAFSAPRLVEYFDENPCEPRVMMDMAVRSKAQAFGTAERAPASDKALGVKVEAKFTVGEYDIVILSAEQSDGLETWLVRSGYKIPKGASEALKPYIKQDMKFFVAKVNLKAQEKTGSKYLRPIQFAFESKKFMLPIRLGMINANGPQDLIVYLLTKDGRVETTNYRTVKLPEGAEIPGYVKGEFADFYRSMFDEQLKRENQRAVFTEYFWDMSWCDPCAADPLSRSELRNLGVFWLEGDDPAPVKIQRGRRAAPQIWNPVPPAPPVQVKLTRLHVRYSKDTFPEDLMFQETQDQQNFQARFVLRHAWKGSPNACAAAPEYFRALKKRQENEAQTLANLTGWEIGAIRKKMDIQAPPKDAKWWNHLWN